MSAHKLPAELNQAPFEVLDPGTGVAIPVTRWNQVVPLTIAASASETNTLAAPTQAGQKLTLFAANVGSGGTRTVTVASAIDPSGRTTLVFDGVDDRVTLESVPVGSAGSPSYEWRVVSEDGLGDTEDTFAISCNIVPHASLTEQHLFTAREALQVVAIDVTPDLVQGGALTGTVCKATGTTAPANGTTPMHTANAINFNATAHTVQSITLTSTVADLKLAAGDKIGLDLSAALSTGRANITIRMKRI